MKYLDINTDKDYLLSLPYDEKIKHCKQMVKDFIHLTSLDGDGLFGVPYISFSGGKDSVCLMHMI